MNRRAVLLVMGLWLAWTAVGWSSEPSAAAESSARGRVVYWIPVKQEIERGLTRFLERTFAEAKKAGAGEIVLEMDTLGGEVTAALEIGKLIRNSPVPVTVFIKGEAISAGSYIALNADRIWMTPGSAMGAAEPRMVTGETADPKTVAFWSSSMRSAAESQGRDPDIAAGMVDRNLVIPGVKKKGELISLSAKQAVRLNMADRLVDSEARVLELLQAERSDVIRAELTPSERLARFVTSPYVIPILFAVGFVGLAIEFFTPGFGLPGMVGLGAFGLYFFGHYLAGFAGEETMVLFAAGLLLMIIELLVPGFGIFGILGLVALGASLVFAAYDNAFSLVSLLIALAVTLVGMAVAIRVFGARGMWNRFVLSSAQQTEAGYVSRPERKNLMGREGVAVTPLRPAGVAVLEGERHDVVSEGGWISSGSRVKVVRVEGVRLVVRRLDDASDE